jgi:hypothetical protein
MEPEPSNTIILAGASAGCAWALAQVAMTLTARTPAVTRTALAAPRVTDSQTLDRHLLPTSKLRCRRRLVHPVGLLYPGLACFSEALPQFFTQSEATWLRISSSSS